jgi:hypothetical protein
MEVPVLIRRTDRGTYRASAAVPESVSSEAPTREEALSGLKQLLCSEFVGAEFVALDIPTTGGPNPWLQAAGTWRDHPDIDDVEQHIRDFRSRIDEDPDHP